MPAGWSGGGAADDDDRTRIRPPVAAPPARARPPVAPVDDDNGGLPVGTYLAEFEITRLVGEGGFGLVYEAYDHSLQRRVALKEYMPSSLASRSATHQVSVKSARHRETFEAGLKSFVNEARLLASFDHPSLIKVYRFWEDNGTAYMVMPFLEGVTLKDYLRSLGSAPDEAWLRSLLGPLTEALGVIHAKQCYHRDIAPDNVMRLDATHKWLLLDFGAARRVIGDMTQALTVILKPGYAPVEQYAEIPGLKQGPWTDVYALAASVYFAIIGKTPPPSVGRLLNDTYVPLVQSAAGRYSEGFLAAIDRALVVRPEARTQDIDALRRELDLDGQAGLSFHPMTESGAVRATDHSWAVTGRREPTISGERTVSQTDHTVADPLAGRAPGPAGLPERPASVARATPLQGPVDPAGSAARGPAAPTMAVERGKGPLLALAGGTTAVLLALAGYRLLAPPDRPAPSVPAAASAPLPVQAGVPVDAGGASAAAAPVPNAPAPAPTAGLDPLREFARVLQARTPGFGVQAQARKSVLHIGRDDLAFSVKSEREGFLYVMVYSADGALLQALPNTVSGLIKLKAGQTYNFPSGNGVVLDITDPPGPGQLLVMVSTRQRDFAALEPRTEGSFRTFPAGTEAAAVVARHTSAKPLLAGTPICAASGCEEDYGAAVIEVTVEK
jgi:serine/threonine protein kinase